MPKPPRDCPCHSGARYAACCGPIHGAARDATTPEERMRSRYSAFALGLGAFLVDTLATTHPDRALPRDPLVRELSRVHERQRFLGLQILHAAVTAPGTGEVLFHARIFEKGADLSFVELSDFVHEDGSWRYASGIMVPRRDLPEDPAALTAAALRARAPDQGHGTSSDLQRAEPARVLGSAGR